MTPQKAIIYEEQAVTPSEKLLHWTSSRFDKSAIANVAVQTKLLKGKRCIFQLKCLSKLVHNPQWITYNFFSMETFAGRSSDHICSNGQMMEWLCEKEVPWVSVLSQRDASRQSSWQKMHYTVVTFRTVPEVRQRQFDWQTGFGNLCCPVIHQMIWVEIPFHSYNPKMHRGVSAALSH